MLNFSIAGCPCLARPSAGGGAAESMTPKTPELTERRDDFTSRQQPHLS
jgi:hypothetical protein